MFKFTLQFLFCFFLLNGSLTAQKIHWVDSFIDRAWKMNVDGTGTTEITPSNFNARFTDVAVDPVTHTVYYAMQPFFGDGTPQIAKVAPGATTMTTVLSQGVTKPGRMALDFVNQKAVWTETGSPYLIKISNFDGSQQDTIVVLDGVSLGVDVDFTAGRVYWTQTGNRRVFAINLDGTNRDTVMTLPTSSEYGLSLEWNPKDGKLYFVSQGGFSGTPTSKLWRVNTDGSGVELLQDLGGAEPTGVALDTLNDKVYWCFSLDFDEYIHRANLDGSGFEAFYDASAVLPSWNIGTFEEVAIDYPAATSGLAELAAGTALFDVFPNPADELVSLSFPTGTVLPATLTAQFYDVSGKTISVEKVSPVAGRLDLRPGLPNGQYWLHLLTATGESLGLRPVFVQR